MVKFLKSLLKYKGALFFAFLIVAIGVLLPKPAMAACGVLPDSACAAFDWLSNIASWFSFTNWSNSYVYPIIWISGFLNAICWYAATGAGKLFSFILIKLLSNDLAITHYPAFLTAWSIIKNWAIIIIDVSLIGAALMLILRLWVDKARQLLPWIIGVALLVNFSGVLVGLFIDLSNIIMRSLMGGTTAAEGSGLVLRINDAWNAIIWSYDTRAAQGFNNIMLYFSLTLLFDILYIVTALALLFFCFILVQRYVMLAILFILSPLAFALYIAPVDKARELAGQWWSAFLKYCFVGLGAAFFLRLAIQVLESFTWTHIAANNYNQFLQFVFQFSIVIGFLLFGLHLAKKSAQPIIDNVLKGVSMGANVLMGGVGIAAGGAKLGVNATSAVAGATGAKGVAERGVNAATDNLKYNRVSNFFRDMAYGKGYSGMQRKQEVEKQLGANQANERAGAVSPKQREEAINGRAVTQEQINFKVASIKAAAEKGELKNMGDIDTQKKLMEYATSRGVSQEIFNKVNPELAKSDTKQVNELIRVQGNQGKTISKQDAENQVAQKYYSGYKIENIDNMSDEEIARKARQSSAEGAKHLEKAVKEGILSMVGTFDETAKLLEESKANWGSNAVRDAAKSDPRYAAHNKQAVQSKARELAVNAGIANPTETDINRYENPAKETLITEGYQRSNILDLSRGALAQIDFFKNAKVKPLSKALERMSAGKIDALKDFIRLNRADIINERNTLRAAGRTKEADELTKVVRAISAA